VINWRREYFRYFFAYVKGRSTFARDEVLSADAGAIDLADQFA
jgi:hypothetical protein